MSARPDTSAIGTTIQRVEVGASKIATDAPESGGTIAGGCGRRSC